MRWIKQEGMLTGIPTKSTSLSHGKNNPQDQVIRVYLSHTRLYKHNHHPKHRAVVEHIFSLIKLCLHTIYDRKENNKFKALL
ncbi:hypothetical protein ES705_06887 [subsurface metagenome]